MKQEGKPGLNEDSLTHFGRRAAGRQRGFSVIEVAAVALVVAIVSAFAVKPISGLLQRLKLESAAEGMKQVIQNARMRAVANPDRQCGVVIRAKGTSSAPDSIFSFLDVTADKVYVRGRDSLYLAPFVIKGSDKIVVSIPGVYPSVIVFRGDGSASASAKVVLTLNGMQDTVDVLASTGRVKVVNK
jgi:prepilin-type N-terminal cleavage/methylation domain-containing protein